MTDTALERAILRDMCHVLAGKPIVVSIGDARNAKPLLNMARHLPPPYRGDWEALGAIWVRTIEGAERFVSVAQGYLRYDPHGPSGGVLSFNGLSDLVRFVRYLDSLEEPPFVKCTKCKQWVPERETRYLSKYLHLGVPWGTEGYYCRGCVGSVLDSFAQNQGRPFPLPAKDGRGL